MLVKCRRCTMTHLPNFLLQSVVTTVSSWTVLCMILCVQVTLEFSFGDVARFVRHPWCVTECCTDEIWINRSNSSGLQKALKSQLFGQHLVTDHVVAAVEAHLTDKDPERPLVLSFHGRTGTGKNYVARMIAESIYKKGMNSKYVHHYAANKHFAHEKRLDEYKSLLRSEVAAYTYSCPYQLFIFDEIEDMPEGLLDSLKPFIDYNVHLDNVDYRKAIFIFLSNTAAMEITQKTYSHLSAGGNREKITLQEMEEVIEKTAYSAKGAFNRSRLIDSYVISHFVPFLPLERQHVRECVRVALRKRSFSRRHMNDAIDQVMDLLQFWPEVSKLFALKGCKNVNEKAALVDHQMRKTEL
ncbi:torsin-1A-like isoform X2 [Patiria miniata]|uniref:Torsin-1A C-terminal domain-containing protein n=1 Tax=Patiria miniata TaxID=46514 RepID=A0A913Z6N3_PATMI|nr:torsin-1A-like isoform X2 [Patiria miniata]